MAIQGENVVFSNCSFWPIDGAFRFGCFRRKFTDSWWSDRYNLLFSISYNAKMGMELNYNPPTLALTYFMNRYHMNRKFIE